MTTYCLEMRSTANWQDVRYREYTSSKRKADLFKSVPRIDFTDSGHGIIPHVREHKGRREPRNMILRDHVLDHIISQTRAPKPQKPTLWEMLRKHGVGLYTAQMICNDVMLNGVRLPTSKGGDASKLLSQGLTPDAGAK